MTTGALASTTEALVMTNKLPKTSTHQLKEIEQFSFTTVTLL